MQYRYKTNLVEAIQFNADIAKVSEFCGNQLYYFEGYYMLKKSNGDRQIIKPGDYLVKFSEVCILSKEVFENIFEKED